MGRPGPYRRRLWIGEDPCVGGLHSGRGPQPIGEDFEIQMNVQARLYQSTLRLYGVCRSYPGTAWESGSGPGPFLPGEGDPAAEPKGWIHRLQCPELFGGE